MKQIVRAVLRFWLSALIAVTVSGSAMADQVTKITRTPLGTPLEVTAGQEFYAEVLAEDVSAYRIAKPFKSSMGGSMGLPFSFSIDDRMLFHIRRSDTSGWEYYAPADGRFRASHALLGSVIREGDTVGLRVHRDGQMEWFVDNSAYNGRSTIWTRKIKDKDPRIERVTDPIKQRVGSSFDRLIYLGLDQNNRIRVRHEHAILGDVVRDEFTFPLDDHGRGVGAVRGAEFTVQAGPLKAIITVVKAMTSGLGEAVDR